MHSIRMGNVRVQTREDQLPVIVVFLVVDVIGKGFRVRVGALLSIFLVEQLLPGIRTLRLLDPSFPVRVIGAVLVLFDFFSHVLDPFQRPHGVCRITGTRLEQRRSRLRRILAARRFAVVDVAAAAALVAGVARGSVVVVRAR